MLVAGTTARDTLLQVDRLPTSDTAQRANQVTDAPGGCGANVAYALARLGHEPRLFSAVGEAFEGSDVEAHLVAAGVDLSSLIHVPGEDTARAVVTSDAQGRQTTIYHEGATPAMRRLDPVEATIGHFAPGELTTYPALMEACETVTYDPGQETFHRPLGEVLAPIEEADLLLANEHEAERITEAYGGLEALLEPLDAVIVTDKEGQSVHTPVESTRVPGVKANTVDPTGAGDAHSAGVVYGLARGWALANACRFGSVLAAFAIEAIGAQTNLPSLSPARQRYEEAYGVALPG